MNHKRKSTGPKPDSEVLLGMAKGPWASHWANEQEEDGVSFSGVDIYDEAPNPPRWVMTWARSLAAVIEKLNGSTLDELYAAACRAGFAKNPETFGYYLGMQAVGHGVHWTDDGADNIGIKVPSIELYEGASVDLRFVHT